MGEGSYVVTSLDSHDRQQQPIFECAYRSDVTCEKNHAKMGRVGKTDVIHFDILPHALT